MTDPEDADFLICVLAEHDSGTFRDNLKGFCCRCDRVVVFRPYNPKRPKRLCIDCAMSLAVRHRRLGKWH